VNSSAVWIISRNADLIRGITDACAISALAVTAVGEGLGLMGEATLPDLVLVDVPDVTFDVAGLVNAVAQQGGDRFVPVIAITPDTIALRVTALRDGAHECITYPFHQEVLSARMLALLRIKSLQDELVQQDDLLKRGNQELVRLSTLKDEFIASLSHELRTPLTSICEFTSLVLDEIPGPLNVDQRECLEIAHANCQHLSMMIDDLLDLSRVVTGESGLAAVSTNLVALVSDVNRSLGAMADSRRVALVFESAGPKLEVLVDRSRMRQVVLNLVSNAIKFTPEGTTVRVVVERAPQAGVALVHVIDEGPGLTLAQQKQVFGRFYQAEPAWISKSGLGLGLTVCMEIMSLHGGRIGVESQPGSGCRFYLELPMDDDGVRLAPVSAQGRGAPESTGRQMER